MVGSLHLTAAEPKSIERIRRQTFRGQASWAVGPRQCQACVFWDDLGRKRKSPLERACRKFEKMTGKIGPRVPACAPACRFFSPAAKKGE
jgi:hypothetical protein